MDGAGEWVSGRRGGRERKLIRLEKITNQYKYMLNWFPISNPKRKQELKTLSEQPENNNETPEWCVCLYHSSLAAEVR